MALSRKEQRELNKLRGNAEQLLEAQREVFGSAGLLAKQAGLQAKALSDSHVAPRVDSALDSVRPYVNRGVDAAQRAATRARIIAAPVLASAFAAAIRGLERADNQAAAQQVQHFAVQRGLIEKPKRRGVFGRVVAITAGVAAAGAVGYALWQAFRSDDELWVAPEDGSSL